MFLIYKPMRAVIMREDSVHIVWHYILDLIY